MTPSTNRTRCYRRSPSGAQYKRNRGIEHGCARGQSGAGSVQSNSVRVTTTASMFISVRPNYFLHRACWSTLACDRRRPISSACWVLAAIARDARSTELEATLGYVLNRRWAIGAEYRQKPHNLQLDDEGAAWDAFIAWAPSKYFSVVGAYLNLGSILAPATGKKDDQDGLYASVQVGF